MIIVFKEKSNIVKLHTLLAEIEQLKFKVNVKKVPYNIIYITSTCVLLLKKPQIKGSVTKQMPDFKTLINCNQINHKVVCTLGKNQIFNKPK